jgi:hypothetical protein
MDMWIGCIELGINVHWRDLGNAITNLWIAYVLSEEFIGSVCD